MRADALTALVPATGWQTMSCGDGSKGPRLCDWALIGTTSGRHDLLARRRLTPDAKGELELAFFTCHARPGSTLAELSLPGTAPASGNASAEPGKKGPAACGQPSRPPRTCNSPATFRDYDGTELIALTVSKIRCLFAATTRMPPPARPSRPMVTLAPETPGPRPAMSLPARDHQLQAAAVVLRAPGISPRNVAGLPIVAAWLTGSSRSGV